VGTDAITPNDPRLPGADVLLSDESQIVIRAQLTLIEAVGDFKTAGRLFAASLDRPTSRRWRQGAFDYAVAFLLDHNSAEAEPLIQAWADEFPNDKRRGFWAERLAAYKDGRHQAEMAAVERLQMMIDPDVQAGSDEDRIIETLRTVRRAAPSSVVAVRAMLWSSTRSASPIWRRLVNAEAVPLLLSAGKGEALPLADLWARQFAEDWKAHYWHSIAMQHQVHWDEEEALAAARRAFDLAVVEGETNGVEPADRLQVACFLAKLASAMGRDDWVREASEAICGQDVEACVTAWSDLRETARRAAQRPIGPHRQEALREWCERAHAARRSFWLRGGGEVPEEFL
jgi:hypothetical protein